MIDGPRHPRNATFELTAHPRPTEPRGARSSFAATSGERTPLDGGAAERCLATAWQEVLRGPETYRRGFERLAAVHAAVPVASGGTPSALDELVDGVLLSLRAQERA